MIFGAQFYPLVNKMTNWRQSLFALVLATRQYPNFKLWTEVESRQGATEFKHVLQQCWEYHFDKFNHIDLTEVFDQVAPYIPEIDDNGEFPNEGAGFAFDAAICLNSAVEAIVMHTNDAESASKASMATVIRLCENTYQDEELTEDTLLEKPEIEAEINFQVDLMELVQHPRTPELLIDLLKFALAPESSNIGLENELKFEDLYRPQDWEAHRLAAPGTNPWLANKEPGYLSSPSHEAATTAPANEVVSTDDEANEAEAGEDFDSADETYLSDETEQADDSSANFDDHAEAEGDEVESDGAKAQTTSEDKAQDNLAGSDTLDASAEHTAQPALAPHKTASHKLAIHKAAPHAADRKAWAKDAKPGERKGKGKGFGKAHSSHSGQTGSQDSGKTGGKFGAKSGAKSGFKSGSGFGSKSGFGAKSGSGFGSKAGSGSSFGKSHGSHFGAKSQKGEQWGKQRTEQLGAPKREQRGDKGHAAKPAPQHTPRVWRAQKAAE